MKKKAKVSIVLPTFNRCKRLSKAIRACLLQTFKDFELIIVDDGSTDDTKNVVRNFNDIRIKYIYQKNMGLPKALNKGFENATGQYLTWTSDDNFYKANAIEIMVNKLDELSEPAFVYADMDIYYEDIKKTVYRNYSVSNRIYLGNYIGACFLYDREIYETIGEYDYDSYLAEDYDYWIRVFEKFKMIHIPENLYIYSDHVNSLSQSKRKDVIKALEKVLEKNDCYNKAMREINKYAGKRNIYIYGKGSFAQRIYSHCNIPNFKGFIDSFIIEKEISFQEIVYPVNKLETLLEKPYIVIASTFRDEIEMKLKDMGYFPNLDFY